MLVRFRSVKPVPGNKYNPSPAKVLLSAVILDGISRTILGGTVKMRRAW
jgi:hypothetical protein